MSKKNIAINIILAILMIAIGIGIGISITRINSELAAVGDLNKDGLVLKKDVGTKEVSLKQRADLTELSLDKKHNASAKESVSSNLANKALATAKFEKTESLAVAELKDSKQVSLHKSVLELKSGLEPNNVLLKQHDVLTRLSLNKKLDVSAKELESLNLDNKALATAKLEKTERLAVAQLKDSKQVSLQLPNDLLEVLAA